jgi:hypothetical protein
MSLLSDYTKRTLTRICTYSEYKRPWLDCVYAFYLSIYTFHTKCRQDMEPRTKSNIHKVIPAKRACTLVAALEPSEEANGVEGVLASCTTLVGGLHIRGDDGIADGAFALSLQGSLDVPSERKQAIHEVSIGEHDHTLDD